MNAQTNNFLALQGLRDGVSWLCDESELEFVINLLQWF